MYTASDASRTAQEMLAGISCSTVLSLPDNTEDLISKPAKHNVERRRGDPYNTKAYPYFNLLLNAAADAGRDDCYAFPHLSTIFSVIFLLRRSAKSAL